MYAPPLIDLVAGSPALRRRQALARLLARGLARMTVAGLENVPASGPVVLAVNHRDFLDGPLLFAFVHRPVAFLTKSEAYTRRSAPLLATTGQIPLVRTRPDVAAVRSALRVLRAGGVVGVFPEGTRGDGLVRTAKPGVGYFALRTGAEQELLVGGFARWLNSLTGPVQIISRTTTVDLGSQISALRSAASRLPHALLQSAALNHSDYLVQIVGNRPRRLRLQYSEYRAARQPP